MSTSTANTLELVSKPVGGSRLRTAPVRARAEKHVSRGTALRRELGRPVRSHPQEVLKPLLGMWIPAALVSVAILAGATACSPGALPGSPSPILVGGGGGRYNGSINYRRLAGNYTVSEATQSLILSLVLRAGSEITGRIETGATSGTLQGTLSGDLANGTFRATILVSTAATQGATTTACEGRGDITGTLSGVNLSWNGGTITYDNCPGLSTTSSAQAVAVSPIPASSGGRANVVITIPGGTSVSRSACATGILGYPFTVEIAETSGIKVTFDSTFTIEERRNFGALTRTDPDMPFTDLQGGARRTYSACSQTPGTYQAFFSGNDANGNRVRVATPLVTMGP